MNRITSRWRSACLVFALSGAAVLSAAETDSPTPPASVPATSLSVGAAKRAPWQHRLTLGAGDLLNVSLYNLPDTVRTEVPIGPDGRLTFLQAQDVMAAGLTIDELRTKLDQSLANYYQSPHTIITPAAWHSKKYIMLGSVANKGLYTFDRPVTLIEAIARAGGLETGVYEQRTVELADLQHSFLVRNGQRMPVDFERLFQHGDLSQNVALEPDDYLYFASASANEIYVLGEVLNPGVLVFSPNPTAMKAIAARGGFSEKAYRRRVLVVRGSLNHPETFVVESAAVLAGKAPDLKLQPKDIVYVSASAWVMAEDLLDTAARAFIQGTLFELTTRNVGPLLPKVDVKNIFP